MSSLQKEKQKLQSSIQLSVSFVVIIWLVHIFEFLIFDLSQWGIYPRHFDGLWGILFYPLLHSDWSHLLSNSFPMLVLGFLLYHSYQKVAATTFLMIYFLSGVGIWLFARESIHLGASGLVYGLAFFLAFSGFFRKDIKGMAIAALVIFLYGGIVWGLLPIREGMSYEGHIAGAVVGVLCAWLYRDVNKPAKVEWNEPPELPIVEEPFWKPAPEIVDELEEDVEEEIPEDIPPQFRYLYKKDK